MSPATALISTVRSIPGLSGAKVERYLIGTAGDNGLQGGHIEGVQWNGKKGDDKGLIKVQGSTIIAHQPAEGVVWDNYELEGVVKTLDVEGRLKSLLAAIEKEGAVYADGQEDLANDVLIVLKGLLDPEVEVQAAA